VIAPPTLVVETNQYSDLPTRPADGYNGHAWEGLPLPVPCTLVRGGNEYELLQPVRPDDRLSVRWSIEEITERQGRAGPMLVLLALAEYRNQRGELLATNRDTSIFLPAAEPAGGGADA
jgi:hydroxyacyl-ACP dehydratase HTD2-like protein with hotdog domain